MKKELVNKYLIREFYSVNIHLSEKEEIFVLHLKRKKNTIKILSEAIYSSLDLCLNELKKDIPLVLSFTGKKIINRISSTEANYLEKILFNKDPEGYYIFEYTQEPNILVSLARREDFNQYLEKVSDNGHSILDFTLGNFVLESLSYFLDTEKKIITPYFDYDLGNATTTESNQENQISAKTTIGEEVLSRTHIVALAGFFCYLNKSHIKKNFESSITDFYDSYIYKKAFNITGKLILISFLLLLSASYIIKGIYLNKTAEIQQEALINNELINEIVNLQRDREYKQRIITNSGLGSAKLLSFYITEIGEHVPGTILLENLNVFPAKKPINPGKKIEITSNIIIIEGTTDSTNSVSEWVSVLNSYNWIHKVELASYVFEKNEYKFRLKLFI